MLKTTWTASELVSESTSWLAEQEGYLTGDHGGIKIKDQHVAGGKC